MEKVLMRNFPGPGESPPSLRVYEKAGGYEGWRTALRMTPDKIIEMVRESGLKGRGGAGFPTGTKWSFVPKGEASRPKYLLINADEMEPGTFKDRLLMENDPHQLIEGALIAAFAVQADVIYVFLRDEYEKPLRLLEHAVREVKAAGYIGENVQGSGYSVKIHIHRSAGRYMCGEETGLISSLEGKRAQPRSKPPYPLVSGLWGKPSVVNNVETLCNVPHIINHGPEWFRNLSATGEGGTKIYGVSGKVRRPGAWELPLGTTAREIIFEHAGGMRDGLELRGVIPGGASTDFILEEHLDTPMDFASMPKAGSRLGTGTMIVFDDQTCIVGGVCNIEKFFARESCGWCTPCREGLPWVWKMLEALEEGDADSEYVDLLSFHVRLIEPPGHTFCALAPGAMAPLGSALKYFRADFERHVGRKCPWRG